jgi:predicted AlkP superfamily phosphohydrolase/phosphomutase
VALSDHGFGPFHKFFHVNNWLAANGWLKFKRSPLTLLKRAMFKMGITPINALKWVTALRLSELRKNVKRGRGGKFLRRLFLSFHDVDWARTQAFSVGNFGQVYLNVQGQRPSAPVPPAIYETLRDEIAQAALELNDEDNGRVIQRVYKREEIFHGRSRGRMPDLILHTDRAQFVSFGHADFGSNRILEPSTGQTGHHHMMGVLGLKGPGIQSALTLAEASLLDVAPTILHYMGLPVPDHMDGKVLTSALTDAFNAANPVRYTRSDLTTSGDDSASAYSPEEAALIMEKLRGMGYVA